MSPHLRVDHAQFSRSSAASDQEGGLPLARALASAAQQLDGFCTHVVSDSLQ
jgi:hypothetical protein